MKYLLQKYNRQRKWDLFITEFNPAENDNTLDVGYSESESIDLHNYIEKHYPYPEKLTALSTASYQKMKKKYPNVKFIKYDGKIFSFNDCEFNICWSNATLEHVGNKERQKLFLSEIFRVSKKAFISVPNRFFPIEGHSKILFLHYLPKKIFDKFLKLIGKEWCTGDNLNLLSYKQIRKLLKELNILNYNIIRNKFFGFTYDFIIIIK